MSRVSKSMLKNARPVYFIVDALDECDQGFDGLIKLVSDSLALSDKVRWLVSSRKQTNLLAQLGNLNKDNPGFIQTLAEVDVQSQKDRAEKYVEHKLSNLKDSESGATYTDSILKEVKEEARKRAQDNFLWMFFVFNALEGITGPYAVKCIENHPFGLPELYDHKLAAITSKEMSYHQYCWDVLMCISLTYRALSISELSVVADLPLKIDPHTIVKICNSFLIIKENTVTPIHKSAKDYLDNNRSRLQVKAVRGHADIARNSIEAMKPTLEIFQQYRSQSKDITPCKDLLGPIRYSCVFWLDHLRDAIKESPQNSRKLCDYGFRFMEEHFLNWLVSLSLLRKLPDGIVSVRVLLHAL
ncbi:hypothetical protein FOVSG1_015051 [Fusarium oxysporum f. sp. vasinfectum]